ncbi:MAG: glycerol-3-phosphate dehydrogenase/oxidase [Ktedonobacterales bacterium]
MAAQNDHPMKHVELSAATRALHLARMAAAPLDILVIGGGITGAGIALDAATRGYRVGLIERGDFASGTSSWSTKLVHGGIRYLPQFDVPLVREALIERGHLLRIAPHLVHPLAFVLPLYKDSRHPVGLPVAPPFGLGLGAILDTGLTLYDRLAGRENIAPHRRLSRAETQMRAHMLLPGGINGGFLYYDAQTDDTRLTLAVLRTAVALGALTANYCEATGFALEDGHIVGAYVRDTLRDATTAQGASHHLTKQQGDTMMIHARHIVNATGVWAEVTERLAQESAPQLRIVPSKGAHLVFARETLDMPAMQVEQVAQETAGEAIVLPETEDGRIIFLVPWRSRVLVGTTDTAMPRVGPAAANDDDIAYLLNHLNRYLRRKVTRADIISTYAGYRPLLELHGATGIHAALATRRLSRTHALVEGSNGLLSISGGKLTTYRRMAEETLDRIDAREGRQPAHPTRRLKLIGAWGWAEARLIVYERGMALGLDTEVIAHLGGSYGTEALDVLTLVEEEPDLGERLIADLPVIRAEVVQACRAELALTLADVLVRRTHLAVLDRLRGVGVAQEVAALMAAELGWRDAERERQVAAYSELARELAGPLAGRLPTHEELRLGQA